MRVKSRGSRIKGEELRTFLLGYNPTILAVCKISEPYDNFVWEKTRVYHKIYHSGASNKFQECDLIHLATEGHIKIFRTLEQPLLEEK